MRRWWLRVGDFLDGPWPRRIAVALILTLIVPFWLVFAYGLLKLLFK